MTTTEKVSVLAKIVTLPGKRQEALDVFAAQVAAVASEEGTEVYALHTGADDDTIWFYELYTDKAALDAHGKTESMKALGPKLAGLLAGRPEIMLLTPVAAKGLSV
jgi:quinol monooxygenase YgiN